METDQSSGLMISWVLADSLVLDPTVDITKLKNIGPLWGSWKTWRSCQTDNVICYDQHQARQLVNRNFQSKCNFYVPSTAMQFLDRPDRIKVFEGQFTEDILFPDEIISMHLASSSSDIVLLYGFDCSSKDHITDKLEKHRWHVQQQLFKSCIQNNTHCQWVLVEHDREIGKFLQELNLNQDKLDNILSVG